MSSDYGHALEDLDKAVKLDPTNVNAWNNRCWVHALQAQLEKALADCKEAVLLRPKNPHSLDSLALTYLMMSRAKKDKAKKNDDLNNAIKTYDSALLISPKQASSLYGRGLAKLDKGDIESGNADVLAAQEMNQNIKDELGKNFPWFLEGEGK